jgi:hypothetical protein
MRNTLTTAVVLCFAVGALASDGMKHQSYRITKKPAIIHGDEAPAVKIQPNALQKTSALGPGTVIMQSTYDYGANGGVLPNIVYYPEDGTIAIGRMGATDAATNDRGTYFSYFDGTVWSAAAKVEAARRGWSSIGALPDGRSVTASHVANEVNIDALKGFGIWTSTVTGNVGTAANQWPRMAVTSSGTIVIASTVNATVNGVGLVKAVAVSTDEGNTWTHRYLWPDTSVYKPSFGADDQAITALGNKVAVVVAADGDNRDVHVWESIDDGATWTYQNLTNNPAVAPAGGSIDYPAGECDAVYDAEGQLHVFWGTYLGLPDTTLNYSTAAGIYHWSQTAGISEVVDFSDVPGSAQDVNIFTGGNGFDQTNSDGNILNQPQAAADGVNLYLLFCSFRPNDFDADSAHYTDVYAVGSNDGGRSWGAVVNVTDSPGTEDNWASLAKNVDDSLRIVYSSDESTGNSIQGGGAAPTTYLYYSFAKASIPFGSSAVNDRPGAGVPAAFALHPSFPNPFNPSTQISFDLAKSVRVKLNVYDISGKLVATLVNSKLEAGTHSITWNANKQPSGIYFAKLEAEGFSQVQKMTLVK